MKQGQLFLTPVNSVNPRENGEIRISINISYKINELINRLSKDHDTKPENIELSNQYCVSEDGRIYVNYIVKD